jgi:general secretion pathway protein G
MTIRTTSRKRRARHGFTLMEILVVVAIIVILAGLGGYYVMGALNSSRIDAAKIKAQEIGKAVQTYNLHNQGQWPPTLQTLLTRDSNGHGPYLKSQEMLIDPWGGAYQYDPSGPMNNGLEPDIWCIGPQGQKLGNWSAH